MQEEEKRVIELTKDEIEEVISWAHLVDSEWGLVESDWDIVKKLEEMIKK